jgi:uncharacterized protein
MKVLIDIGHPAHVHLFKNAAHSLINNGHQVLFTCRDKEFEIDLLRHNGFKFISFGRKYNKPWAKIWGLLEFDAKMILAARKFKPDLFLSHGSMYAAHAAFILGKPHIALEDTFNKEQLIFSMPFTSSVLTGDYDHPVLGKKEIRYSGYHELAYLHPNQFVANNDILNTLNVSDGEKYVIMRFVSWNASHDIGHKGISLKNKIKAVREFERYAKVFISAESNLPEELERNRIRIEPQRMHDALSFATLLWGESFTMPAECAVLGTPSIINHNTKSFYLYEQEHKYDLCYNYSESQDDQLRAIQKGIELLQIPDVKSQWKQKQEKMLNDKIDVTAFLVWFIENYPQSAQIMKENPDYQYNFK